MFCTPKSPDRFWRPSSFLAGGYVEGRGIKRPGREVDQSRHSSAEVQDVLMYTARPPHAFMKWCLCFGKTWYVSVSRSTLYMLNN
jgi:hypothetical protein